MGLHPNSSPLGGRRGGGCAARTACLSIIVCAAVACGDSKPSSSKAPPPETPPAPDHSAALAAAEAEAARAFGRDALIAAAGQGAVADRARALRGLGRVADAAAIDAIRSHLADADPSVRVAAIDALAIADASDAAEPVAGRLSDDDAGVRRAAARALGRVGTRPQLGALAGALAADDVGLVADAAVALGVYGRRKVELDDATRAALVPLATHADPAVRYGAAYAMAYESLPAGIGIGQVGRRGGGGPSAFRTRVDIPAPAPAVGALRGLADDADPAVRALAVGGLGRRGVTEVAQFRKALSDDDWRVRVQAVRAMSGAKSTPALRASLATWLAAEWTALSGDPALLVTPRVHPLLEGLAGLRDHRKERPVRAMFDEIHGASAGAAGSRWKSTPAHQAARDAVNCLAAAGRGIAADVLACGDPSGAGWPAHLRRALAAELAPTEALANDADPRVRAAALGALIEAGGRIPPWAQAPIERALASEHLVEVGTVVDAIAARVKKTSFPTGYMVLLGKRAAAEAGADPELTGTLLDALTAAKLSGGEATCRKLLDHANRTVRAKARACVTAFTSADPGATDAAERPPAPPVDPRTVVGKPVTWTLTTARGDVVIELDPAAAPWHVAMLAKLAKEGFYDGLLWHRVVPDFVVQGGDPDGSGWGGPGYLMPAEHTAPGTSHRFDRGAVGIADAGLDTGGCQIFIMHSRAPHLEGRYTRVGRVTAGMDVVDGLIAGDAIDKTTVRVGP